ncbi:MAG: tRNA (adenosine(37)-N6)-threonylcarbamoyltransferase complex ATPase subunit type 1 TsaE, partial [Sphingobacterium sp.]
MEIIVNTTADLSVAAQTLLNRFPKDRIFLLYGPMGAGKTTFIKYLCEQLGVKDSTSSPTFSIVNEYDSDNGPIYHFDFYRIKDEQEAFDFG